RRAARLPAAPRPAASAEDGGVRAEAALVERVHGDLLGRDPAGDVDHEGVRALVRRHAPLLDGAEEASVVAAVLARVRGLGPLEPLLADPEVTEVMVNGGGRVWVERAGTVHDTGTVLDEGTALRLVERIVAPLGLR